MSVNAPAVDEAVDVMTAGDVSAPVFVDATGRRGRRIRFFFHLSGVAALVYAVLVLVAAFLFTGPLDLLSFPAPAQSASATTPAKQHTPAPGQPGKRATGTGSARSSAAPGAAGASVKPSGSVSTAPSPEATTSAPPSASPSATPVTPVTSAAATATPQPSAPQSSAPGATVVVVVGPA
ncbi:hypothetical protein [Dactylosporangium sp. NPDC005555]|uniref:hypothetical protein n=1 Tax=Dactylosporangium sp. NPDC005555 TaxID=3154889 RepID=UPI0033B00332